MRNFKFQNLLAIGLLVFSLSSCDAEDENVVNPPKTIVDLAIADPNFSTLVAALTKADLVGTLQGSGPFTVFAPTNAAFAAAGIDVNALSKEQLTPVLLNHVLAAKVKASDVVSGAAATVGGGQLFLTAKNGVSINGNTKVTTADLEGSNGVIHVIDNVLLPASKSIAEIAVGDPANFSTLVTLLQSADLVNVLTDVQGNFTVFAPTNAAFEKLFAVVDPASLSADQVKDILLYHVAAGRVFSTDLENGDVTMLNGKKVNVNLSSGVKIDGGSSDPSGVVSANVLATNGVIHVIDNVLLP